MFNQQQQQKKLFLSVFTQALFSPSDFFNVPCLRGAPHPGSCSFIELQSSIISCLSIGL